MTRLNSTQTCRHDSFPNKFYRASRVISGHAGGGCSQR
ncbi:hypothetical protein PAMC26577_19190 [Caballeronia sordidicola]|uniref:Uncharacterized protein n=1 Tax=Caballeronia sordidicola TaxID=196367 RepID=A0A242MNR1_CABSO|nr:hypothetical protein PAMC26577_19190 [Caballeronia sordidicola]